MANPPIGVTITPEANRNGAETFNFIISDGHEEVAGSFTINWAPVFDAPVAQGTTIVIAPDSPGITFDPQADDVGPDGQMAQKIAIALGTPSHGTVEFYSYYTDLLDHTFQKTSKIIYTPDPGFRGVDTFTYESMNGGTYSNWTSQTELITVIVDNAPVLGADTLTVTEEGTGSLDLLANDADPDGDALTLVGISGQNVSQGSVIDLGAVGSLTVGAGGSVTFTGSSNWTGSHVITYTFNNTFTTFTGSLTLIATPLPDETTLVFDAVTTAEDTPVTFDPLEGATDPDGTISAEVASIVSGPAVLNPDGTITVTPAANYSGDITVILQITDATTGRDDTHSVTVTVTPANDAPDASPVTISAKRIRHSFSPCPWGRMRMARRSRWPA